MKFLKVIKNIFMVMLAVIYFSFVITMTVLLLNYNDYGVTQFDDTALIKIKEEISSDKYQKGDLVIVKAKKIEDLQIGDEVFTYKVDQDAVTTIDLGIVGEKHPDETNPSKDAISFENGSTYAMEFVAGSAVKVYNKLGTILSIIESRWGFLFIVLIPSFLILIYEVYALIVEIKYGKEIETT